MTLRELSLFTGAGGGLLGTHLLGWKAIGYVEFNEYCQRVIRQRIDDGILPAAPIFGDVRQFVESGAARQYRGFADVVTGGFPCQPFSVAGKQAGADDARNMWPATIATIRAVRPRYAFLENVPGILSSGYFGTILGDLAESGYDCRWRILSAAEVGAPHKRDRLWIVAYPSGTGSRVGSGRTSRDSGQGRQSTGTRQSTLLRQEHGADCAEGIDTGGRNVSNTDGTQWRSPSQPGQSDVEGWNALPQGRQQGADGLADLRASVGDASSAGLSKPEHKRQHGRPVTEPSWWEVEPAMGRVVDGYAGRVAELTAAGNAQVPAVAAAAWHLLTEGL